MESKTEPRDYEKHGDQIELFGDPGIASMDAKVSTYLKLTYVILPIWGLITLYYFWNGSLGWFDRGAWHELQIAANTTFPIENQNMMPMKGNETIKKDK
jgi:hypothetical protein